MSRVERDTGDKNLPLRKIEPTGPVEIGDIKSAKMYFSWRWPGIGFGELFAHRNDDGTWTADTEMMSPKSVREFLHAFADRVADELEKDQTL